MSIGRKCSVLHSNTLLSVGEKRGGRGKHGLHSDAFPLSSQTASGRDSERESVNRHSVLRTNGEVLTWGDKNTFYSPANRANSCQVHHNDVSFCSYRVLDPDSLVHIRRKLLRAVCDYDNLWNTGTSDEASISQCNKMLTSIWACYRSTVY